MADSWRRGEIRLAVAETTKVLRVVESGMGRKRDPRHVPVALFSEDSVGQGDASDGERVDEERRDPVLVAALGYR
jgi:hypothetical protein